MTTSAGPVMDGAKLLELILPAWRAVLPPHRAGLPFDRFLERNRSKIEALLTRFLERRAALRAASTPAPAPKSGTDDVPPEWHTKARRTEANLAAMHLIAGAQGRALTAEERRIAEGYSGWGGLSIEENLEKFPPDFRPDAFALIHEYYTASSIARAIAEAVCPLLPQLAGLDGVVRALEPSVGIGRLVRPFDARRCLEVEAQGKVREIRWTAIELSPVSARIFAAVRPDVELHSTHFERWVAEHGPKVQHTYNLVIGNPPYGQRGDFAADDPHPDYQERAAYAYFMHRSLDLLAPGGMGVYIVPAGFLSGVTNKSLRHRILRRHHLAAAFRLPSRDERGREVFPGAHNVVDVVFFRARGGELSRLDEADEFIVQGEYFTRHPEYILGREDGAARGEDDLTKKPRHRYAVIGDFSGLPPLEERPVCESCALRNVPRLATVRQQSPIRSIDAEVEGLDPSLEFAVSLGRRFDQYMRLLAADDPEAADLWLELRQALLDFQGGSDLRPYGGNPWMWPALRQLASRQDVPAAQQLLNAFTQAGELVAAIADKPAIERKFQGQPGDIVAQAEHLFRAQRRLKVKELGAFHRAQGGPMSTEEILEALFAADWNLDGPGWDELRPLDAYLAGRLWPRHDLALARAQAGDPQAHRQLERLLAAMHLAVFEDILDFSPRQRWVSLKLLSDFLGDSLNRAYGPVPLELKDGLVQPPAVDYEDVTSPELGKSRKVGRSVLSPETVWFLGWINHDAYLFKPELTEDEKIRAEAELRVKAEEGQGDSEKADEDDDEDEAEKTKLALAREYKALLWERAFRAWVEADEDRRAQVTEAFNRHFRGTIVPNYESVSLDLARWGKRAPRLRPHQVAGVRRVAAQRGGLVAFDVGVGKTYTAIGIVVLGRQEGWIRRPVVLVPSSLVWKWHDDFVCVVPTYRVAVIGSKRKRLTRGPRKGQLTTEADTGEERAQKWIDFQAGKYDVVILSYDAMPRTRLNEEAVYAHVDQITAIRRQIKLRQRNIERKDPEKRTEREEAILKHGTRAFTREMLALREDHKFDPGIAWDDIGIDALLCDESSGFKNLYKPESREHGIPKFMGSATGTTKRAWQFEFRAAAVRRRTGGTGIVLLTATPAKNSPLELYNLIQFIDPEAFTGRGLLDPEQFIDRFLKIESMEVVDAAFNVKIGSAVTGFKNLDDLRSIVLNYAEFRSGEQVGLKLPQPDVRQVRVPMNELQEEKYDKIVARIERLMEMAGRDKDMAGRLQFKILGLLQRLSAIALHPLLDEGYDASNALTGGIITETTIGPGGEEVITKRALPPPDFAAPKLLACAERVVASPGCGHIIFCESLAAQIWMREVLVSKGVVRERIAIINGSVNTGDRVRIAREFNGQSGEPPPPGTCGGSEDTLQAPKYDVVILNIVGQEGIDLQVRTCAIHHLDMTWTPSDLEQRNGRAVRQGNTLETIQIFYYLSDRSMDWYRYSLVAGKRGWLVSLLDSQSRDTNNPGAQQQLSTEDILLLISRDEEKTKKKLEERREQRRREALLKMAREAAILLQQASARFRDARETRDYVRAAKLRAEGETRLADLARVSAEAWPWGRWAEAAREFEVIVPANGGAPVFEGLRMRVPGGMMVGSQHARFVEFGRVVSIEGGVGIGVRALGGGSWIVVTPARIERLGVAPEDLLAGFPEDEAALRPVIEAHILGALGKGEGWEGLGLREGGDAWLVRWWPTIEKSLLEGIRSGGIADEVFPAAQENRLVLRQAAQLGEAVLLPPTRAGWERFLSLALGSGEKFMALREVGERYWLRKIPRDLLSRAAGDDEAADAAPSDQKPATTPALAEVATSPNPAPAANSAPATAEVARPSVGVGHAYRVGGRWYGDTSIMRALEGPFRLSHLGYGDFEAKGDVGAIRIFRYSDDALLPGQQGRLHTLSFTGGDEGLGEILEKLAREGALEIVGSYDAMPSKEPPPAPPAPEFGEIRSKEDLTRALAVVGGKPQEWASRGEWDRLRDYDGPGQDIVARAYTWVLSHKRDLYAQSIDAMDLARDRKDALKQALVDAHDTMQGVGALDAILRRARDEQVVQAGADAAAGRQARALEAARTRLRALGLPAATEKSYLKKISGAIEAGKSPDRLLRNAAKKAAVIKRDADRRRPPPKLEALPRAGEVPATWLDHVLDAFNDEPGPRLAPVRPRANGYVFVVHAEDGSPASPLASIDVLDGQVEDVRWLDERVSSSVRDAILERLERALEEVDGEELEEGEAQGSPLDELVRRLARKAQTLGADPTRIGQPEIAKLLQEFAEPDESSVRGFETWLEDNHLLAAGETVGQARGEDPPLVSVLVRDLWDAILDELRIETIAKGETGLRVYFDAVFDVEDSRGGRVGYVVLHTGDKHQFELAKVRVTGEEDDGDYLIVEDLGGQVAVGTEVYANHHDLGLGFFRELFRRAGLFEDTLRRAPRLLADVRGLLYWTTLLVEGPRCQGATKRAATEALAQARRYYDLARERLIEGRSVDAVTRMHDALRRISTAAALVGESCGEGQIDLVPPRLEVREDDKQVLEGEEN